MLGWGVGVPLPYRRRSGGLAPAELAFEDMPRGAHRNTYFARMGHGVCQGWESDVPFAKIGVRGGLRGVTRNSLKADRF